MFGEQKQRKVSGGTTLKTPQRTVSFYEVCQESKEVKISSGKIMRRPAHSITKLSATWELRERQPRAALIVKKTIMNEVASQPVCS